MKKNKKVSLFGALFVLALLALQSLGLAQDQEISVFVPATAVIILTAPSVTFSFPSLNNWDADTNTQTSRDFYIITYINGSNNPNMVVYSSDLRNGVGGPTIPLSGFKIYLTPQWGFGTQTSGTLDKPVVFTRIGRGLSFNVARYDLTISADQPSGVYTGTVTFTLVNS